MRKNLSKDSLPHENASARGTCKWAVVTLVATKTFAYRETGLFLLHHWRAKL